MFEFFMDLLGRRLRSDVGEQIGCGFPTSSASPTLIDRSLALLPLPVLVSMNRRRLVLLHSSMMVRLPYIQVNLCHECYRREGKSNPLEAGLMRCLGNEQFEAVDWPAGRQREMGDHAAPGSVRTGRRKEGRRS